MPSVPVTILGGSDGRPGHLPEDRGDLHPLGTYKGTAIRVRGRPLIALLIDRLKQVRGFGPVTIAGPARLYGSLKTSARIVDTDGTVGENAGAAFEEHRRQGGGPLALLSCDVLPSVRDLKALHAAWVEGGPAALFFPLVPVPEDPAALGVSGYKPSYWVSTGPDHPPVSILPGHLGICRPDLLRLPLLSRMFEAAYATRNTSVNKRRFVMLLKILKHLVGQDLRSLTRLRAPTLTAGVFLSGLDLSRRLNAGDLQQRGLEGHIRRVFCKRDSELGVRLPLIDCLSLAADIDTEEEAQALGHDVTIADADPPVAHDEAR